MSFPANSLYSLTWGDYGASLVSTVQSLRCHGDLVDCTLAAGGRSFPAHKIVLCAASTFLMELLKNTPCKHPVVMLAGVNANDLESLLEFVYRGEVSVDHLQLPSLLQAAHCLKIQGLAPQTLTRDDYTTQIQLHPTMLAQNHVDNANSAEATQYFEQTDDMMTMEEPQQQIHAHVVEEILPHELTEVVTTDVKDVISQYLPTRKRKPRAKKPNNAKVPRTETILVQQQILQPQQQHQQTVQVQQVHQVQQVQHVQQVQQQQQQQQQQVVQQIQHQSNATSTPIQQSTSAANISNGEEGTSSMTSTPKTKSTVRRKAAASGVPKTPADQQTDGIDDPNKEPKTRSQSEQPASCPICGAVIRQSRNLRRHLELRHFSKPGIKKERKSGPKASKSGAASANAGGTGTAGRVVTVKKEPEETPSTSAGNSSQTIQLSVEPNNQHLVDSSDVAQHIVTQHENTDGTTSLTIAQVQNLQGHQLTLGSMNQGTIQLRNDDTLESNLITTHEPTLRPHTELFRAGTVYTLEERRLDNNKLS